MVSQFADNSSPPKRALQAWLILIGRARNRQTLTYTQLHELMHYGAPVGLGRQILDYIKIYCSVNDLPPLTIIVVKKDAGVPGSGFGDFDLAEQEAVFKFDWYSIMPPTPAELDRAFKQAG
jgi:hypothetical protein